MRRGSKHYDSPPSKIPAHIMERRAREDGEAPKDTEAELRSEIVKLKAQIVTLRETARAALDALSDYEGWLEREEERHGDRPVQPPHFAPVF